MRKSSVALALTISATVAYGAVWMVSNKVESWITVGIVTISALIALVAVVLAWRSRREAGRRAFIAMALGVVLLLSITLFT